MEGLGGLGSLVQQGLTNLENRTQDLQNKMTEFSKISKEDQAAQLLEMQFQVGQYNTVVELTSNITKTLSDSIKSISQKL